MNILLQLINLGITENSTPLEKKRSKVLNLCSLISLFASLFFLCFDFAIQQLTTSRMIILVAEIVIFCGILYLQKRKYLFLS
ncbi:hypothetical protein, partial [Aquimarina sp. Aq78]